MGYTVNFDSGHSVNFDQQPSPEDIQAVADKLFPKQPSALGQAAGAVGQGIAMGGQGILKGAALGIGGVAGALGAHDTANQFFEAVRKENAGEPGSLSKGIHDFFGDQGMAPQGNWEHASNLISGITTLGAGAPGAIGAMAGGATEHMDQLSNQGVDPSTALASGELQFGGNLAAGAVLPKGLLPTIGANVAANAAVRAATTEYLKHQGYNDVAAKQPAWDDAASMVSDAVFGGVAHALWGEKPTTPEETPPAEHTPTTPQEAPGQLSLPLEGGYHQPDLFADRTAPRDFEAERPEMYGEQGSLLPKGFEPGNQMSLFPEGTSHDNQVRKDTEQEAQANQMADEGGHPGAGIPGKDTAIHSPNYTSFLGRDLSPGEQAWVDQHGQGDYMHPEDREDANLHWNSVGGKDISHLVDAQGRIDPMQGLDWISKNSDGYLRYAAKMLQRFPGIFESLDAYVQQGRFDGYANEHGAVGSYYSGTHSISLGSKYVNDRVFMHEMFHAATTRVIDLAGTKFSNPKIEGFKKDLDTILARVRDAGGPRSELEGDPWQRTSYEYKEANVKRGPVYGLTNVKELISETFSNPNFQRLLQKIKIRGIDGYTAIKDGISKVFGGSRPTVNAVIDVTKAIAEYHAQNFNKVEEDSIKAGIRARNNMETPMQSTARMANEKGITEDPVDKAVSQTPGLGKMQERYVEPAPKPEMIKSAMQGVKDLPKTVGEFIQQHFTISNEQYANLKRNPAIYMFGKLYSRANSLSHFYEDTVVNKLREDIKRLIPDSNWKSLKNVKDLMIKEDLANKPDVDAQGKLSPAEKKVYDMMRETQKKNLDFINDKRLANGMDPIKPRDQYMTSHWSGPWKVEVTKMVDGSPRTVGWVAGHSKAEVRKGMEYIKKNNPDYQMNEKIDFRRQLYDKGQDYMTTYKDFITAFGKDDPHTKAFADFINDYYAKEGKNVNDFSKHFEPKTGSKYFVGDRPWLYPRKDTVSWWGTQLDHMAQGYKWAAMQDAVHASSKILSDPELKQSHPNTLEYLAEHARVQMGFGKDKLISGFENAVFKGLGELVDTIPGIRNVPMDLRAGTQALKFSKNLIYLKALGFWKPQHFLVNGLFQPFFTMPRHMKLTAEGYSHNPLETLTHGMKDAQAILLNHYSKGLNGGNTVKLSDLAKKAADFLITNQVATNNPFSDVGELGRSKSDAFVKKSQAIGGYFMQEGERVARVNAFMSFVHHLRQSGKYGDLDVHENLLNLFSDANRQTTETMGSFRHTDRALAFTKLGLLGTGLSTLRQFEINFLNQFHDYAKLAIEKNNYAPLLAMSGIQLAYAGIMGFVGFESLDQLYKWFRDMVPTKFVSPEFAQWSPKNFVMQHLPFEAQRGLVSPWTGINFASSLESGTIVDPSITGLFPFLSELKNTTEPVWNYISDPSKDNLHKMIYNQMPYGMRGMMETGKAFGQDLPEAINTRDWFTSPSGVSSSPNNPGVGNYKRGEAPGGLMTNEENIRSWGFMGTKEAATKERDFASKENEQSLQDRRDTLTGDLDSAIRNKDMSSATDYIQKYVGLGGDPRTLMSNSHFRDLVMKWNTDYQQKAAMGARNLEGVEKYMRLRNYLLGVQNYYGPANAANQGRGAGS